MTILADAGYRLEAYPRHAEHAVRDLGLVGAEGGRLPGAKEDRSKMLEVSDGGFPETVGVDSFACRDNCFVKPGEYIILPDGRYPEPWSEPSQNYSTIACGKRPRQQR